MQAPKKPFNEAERLEALNSYRILDTESEPAYDDVAKLAAYICQTPMALVTLVDGDRHWFKAKVGIDEGVTESPRDTSFCGHIVYDGKKMVVNDATRDERFADNPLVTGELAVRFYAGEPLTDDAGNTFGSLCVIDNQPRELTPEQNTALAALARQVMSHVKSRREAARLTELANELATSQRLLTRFFAREDAWMGIAELIDGVRIRQLYNNPRVTRFFADHGLNSLTFTADDRCLPDHDKWFDAYRACATTQQAQSFEFNFNNQALTRRLRTTVNYLGLSEQGHPQMAFSVDDVTKVRADERLLEDQRRMVINSSKLSSLGEMAAGMAHEINNPLAIIGGRAQEMRMLIDRNAPAAQLTHALDSIEKTVLRISKIIKGLRSFARESSRDPMVPTRIGDVLQDTLSFCQARFNAHGVRLDVAAADGAAVVKCRSAELSQVFLNLLNNAFDALENQPGDRWVRVQFHVVADLVEVWVTDSGTGIRPEIRDKIMQPFFTTKPVDRGTGLGLSITRGIVEAHGGQFILDEACANTRFIIRVPRARQEQAA